MTEIVLYGTGGIAREILALIEEINVVSPQYHILGLLDDNASNHGKFVDGYPVIGGMDWVAQHLNTPIVIGIGNCAMRYKVATRVQALGGVFSPALLHPTASVRRGARLGRGTVVCANSIVSINAMLGDHVLINLSCTVGHDSVLGDFSTISPLTALSGNVELGRGCDMGTNSAVIQGKSIGAWSTIGAGAVVTTDLPANVTAVGVPAKVIKTREDGWQL